MIVRAIDATGEWTFGRGKNDYLTGSKALIQNIRTRLSSFLGDCFFDTTAGIDWFNLLGSKNIIGLRLVIGAVIINTQDVSGVLELSVNLNNNNRSITITYKVQSSFGTPNDVFQFDVA